MSDKTHPPADPWALFRFSVIGGLLARPPAKGELQKELSKLAGRIYPHPVTNKPVCFHFSTIETLVTDRALENYISFQFKGGAADVSRKIRRAELVARILEKFGFQTEVKGDGAFARMQDREQAIMEDCLRVLGYISIHTRQLDMVLGTGNSMHIHQENILNDLQKVVQDRFSISD